MERYDNLLHSADDPTARLVAYYAGSGRTPMMKKEIALTIGMSTSAISRIDSIVDQNRYSVRNILMLSQAFRQEDKNLEPGHLLPAKSSYKRVFDLGGKKALKELFPEYSGEFTDEFFDSVLQDMFEIEDTRNAHIRTRRNED